MRTSIKQYGATCDAAARQSWIARCWRTVCVRVRDGGSGSVGPYWDRNSAYLLALAAVRQKELLLAERELTRGDGDRGVNDARCLNLLGVIHELNGELSQARGCYARAAALDKSLYSARINLRRHCQIAARGYSTLSLTYGDEMDPIS